MKRFPVPEKDNAAYPKRGTSGGRPGVGKDGAKGVPFSVTLSAETLALLDEWAAKNDVGRGPAVRKMVEGFLRAEIVI